MAPNEQEHKEYINSKARRLGIPANVPDQAMECIENGKIAEAIKILKIENPDSNFANLKGYVDMIRKKARNELTRQIKAPGGTPVCGIK